MRGHYLKDEERSAFGLGYEFNRRGRPLDDNPFDQREWQAAQFREGWRAKEAWNLARRVKSK